MHTQKTTVLKLVHTFEGLFEFAVLFEIIGSKEDWSSVQKDHDHYH